MVTVISPSLVAVFAACSAFHVTRDERLEWAGLVLDRNITSFKELSPGEVERLRDAAQGATWMAMIKRRDRHDRLIRRRAG